MDSAAYALHAAAVARLQADADDTLSALGIDSARDVTVEPGQGQALPYIILNGTLENPAVFSTTTTGTDNVLNAVAWSTTHEGAVKLAAACVAYLADRDAPLSASGFQFRTVAEPSIGPQFRDPGTASARPWACALSVRYRIHRTV